MIFYFGNAAANAPFAPPSYPIDFRDDFESNAGNVNGRTGWTVQTRTSFGSQSTAFTVGSGVMGGTTGTAAYAWNQVTDPNTARVTRIIGADMPKLSAAAGSLTSHISLDTGTPSMFQFNHTWLTTGGVDTGRVTFSHYKNTTVGTTIVQLTNLRMLTGDAWSEVWATGTVTPYLNGRQCWPAVDVSAHVGAIGTGVPLVGRFGTIGNIGAATYQDYWSSSSDQAWIMAYMPNRIVRRNSNGGGDWYIPISYSGVIGRVDYQIHNAADNTVRVAWTQATVTSNVIQFSTNSTQTPTAGTHYVVLRRSIGSGNYVYSRGPVQTIGYVVLQSGQSLGVHASNQTSTTAIAIATTCWRIDATTTISDSTQRRQLPQGADMVISWLGQTFSALASSPLQFIAGGQSSTSISERLPASSIYVAEVDGLAHAGGRVNFAFETGGQNETANTANFKAQLITKWEAIRDLNGGSLKVILDPMAASWTSTDSTYQTIRRGHWELTQDRPDLFVGGAHSLDIRHNDDLHLGTSTTDPYGSNAVWNARRARNLAFHAGITSADYRGPRLRSVTKLDNQTLYWTFYLDSFDSIELINTGGGAFHGGTRVSASTAMTSPIWPTGATVDASPTSDYMGVTMSYPSGSLAGTVYCTVGWGANPHNPLQDATINSSTWATAASILRGVKSGLPSVGVQPYYGASVDYLTAS